MTAEAISATRVEAHMRAWVERAVIGLNLCPFARAVQSADKVCYTVSAARDGECLLRDLHQALEGLAQAAPDTIETTVLIAPQAFPDFLDFNDFLDLADALLVDLELDGTIQIASFHPRFQFAETEADDPGNSTNQAPYPCLHLLREDSIARAVAGGADAQAIVARNIDTLERLGRDGWDALRGACLRDAGLERD